MPPVGLGGREELDADPAGALAPDTDVLGRTTAGGCLPSTPSLPSNGLKLRPDASHTNTPEPRAVASSMVDLPPPLPPASVQSSLLKGWNANGPHPALPPAVCVEWLNTTLGMCGLFERKMAIPCGPDRAIAVPDANDCAAAAAAAPDADGPTPGEDTLTRTRSLDALPSCASDDDSSKSDRAKPVHVAKPLGPKGP